MGVARRRVKRLHCWHIPTKVPAAPAESPHSANVPVVSGKPIVCKKKCLAVSYCGGWSVRSRTFVRVSAGKEAKHARAQARERQVCYGMPRTVESSAAEMIEFRAKFGT